MKINSLIESGHISSVFPVLHPEDSLYKAIQVFNQSKTTGYLPVFDKGCYKGKVSLLNVATELVRITAEENHNKFRHNRLNKSRLMKLKKLIEERSLESNKQQIVQLIVAVMDTM